MFVAKHAEKSHLPNTHILHSAVCEISIHPKVRLSSPIYLAGKSMVVMQFHLQILVYQSARH
jgi:hypothetical protein